MERDDHIAPRTSTRQVYTKPEVTFASDHLEPKSGGLLTLVEVTLNGTNVLGGAS